MKTTCLAFTVAICAIGAASCVAAARAPLQWRSVAATAAGAATVADTDRVRADDNSDPRAVQPERPTVATHAGTVAPGYLEIETGIERDRASDRTGATLVPTVFKFGVTRTTQLSIVAPLYGSTRVPFGVGDVALGVKWRIAEGGGVLQRTSLQPQVKFATGGARGTGTTDVSLLLINSRTIGPVAIDLNVTGVWRTADGTGTFRTGSLWAASAGLPVRGPLGWAVEFFGSSRTSSAADGAAIVALLTGPTYLIRPSLAVDLGVIVPIAGRPPRAFYLGLVTNLGQLLGR